jgi:hypothetical protein
MVEAANLFRFEAKGGKNFRNWTLENLKLIRCQEYQQGPCGWILEQVKNKEGAMRILAVSLFIVFTSAWAQATPEEAVIIEVRKKVKLHDTERTYADYFIRGGTKLGLSPGVLVSVLRRVPVHDPLQNASVGDFQVKVADIEIILADDKKAIGRLVEIDRRQARPMLTYDAIMIGDKLDLTSMRAKVSHREAPSSVFDQPRSPASIHPVVPAEQTLENNTPELTNP